MPGSSALSEPRDHGVYVIHVCGCIIPSCNILGVGLGELAPFAPVNPVFGRLSLTNDDFRIHLPLVLTLRIIRHTTHPFADPTKNAVRHT